MEWLLVLQIQELAIVERKTDSTVTAIFVMHALHLSCFCTRARWAALQCRTWPVWSVCCLLVVQRLPEGVLRSKRMR